MPRFRRGRSDSAPPPGKIEEGPDDFEDCMRLFWEITEYEANCKRIDSLILSFSLT